VPAQLVTAGDANDEPVPAIPAAVMFGRWPAAGGVADVVGTVVDVVGVLELVVVVASMLVEDAAPATTTGVVIKTSASIDVAPASANALHRRRRVPR